MAPSFGAFRIPSSHTNCMPASKPSVIMTATTRKTNRKVNKESQGNLKMVECTETNANGSKCPVWTSIWVPNAAHLNLKNKKFTCGICAAKEIAALRQLLNTEASSKEVEPPKTPQEEVQQYQGLYPDLSNLHDTTATETINESLDVSTQTVLYNEHENPLTSQKLPEQTSTEQVATQSGTGNHTSGPPKVEPNYNKTCPDYKYNWCENIKTCKYQHPTICRDWMRDGLNACNPRQCKRFHPRICNDSFWKGECINLACSKRHLKTTKRYRTIAKSVPDQESRPRSIQTPRYDVPHVTTERRNGNAHNADFQKRNPSTDPGPSTTDSLADLKKVIQDLMKAMSPPVPQNQEPPICQKPRPQCCHPTDTCHEAQNRKRPICMH